MAVVRCVQTQKGALSVAATLDMNSMEMAGHAVVCVVWSRSSFCIVMPWVYQCILTTEASHATPLYSLTF